MTDRGRPFANLSGYSNSTKYLNSYLNAIERNYSRDLMQTRNERLEIWTEKDALSSVLARFARPYRVSVQTCKGFGSGSQFNDVKERNRRPLRILYCGLGDGLEGGDFAMVPP